MKKAICILLILCCFSAIVGCTAKDVSSENSVTVYYKREQPTYGSDDSIIAACHLNMDDNTQNYNYVLEKYLRATPMEGFVSPFPTGLSLISFKLEGLTAKVMLGDLIAELTGIDLTIALTCLTQTIMSLTGCHEVIISAFSKELDGQKFITLSRDSYLLLDNGAVSQE